MGMLERDIRMTLAAYVEHSRAELARVESAARRRASTVETPPGYLLATEAQEKYLVSYRRLRAWVRVGRVQVIRGRNAQGLPIYCYNEVDIARAKRENPNGPVVVWEPEPTTGIAIESRRRRRLFGAERRSAGSGAAEGRAANAETGEPKLS